MKRRGFLLGVTTSVVAVAGCQDVLSEDSGPQERSFDVTISASNGEPAGTVEGADIEDVVQVHVGDTVHFTFINDTGDSVGVHDHASDAELLVEPGAAQSLEFEVTEAMTGRQEIEAWFAAEADESAASHETDATTIVIVEVRPRGS